MALQMFNEKYVIDDKIRCNSTQLKGKKYNI